MPPTRSLKAAAIALCLIAAGLVWRLAPLHLPPFWFKYGGSAIWGAMVYWLVAAALPTRKPAFLILVAALVAALTESTRLFHTPGFDAFRLTLAGKLLLGRVFSLWNILVYWLGILLAGLLDSAARSRATRPG